jgi:hypothetical protein
MRFRIHRKIRIWIVAIAMTTAASVHGGMMWWRWFGRFQFKAIIEVLSLFMRIPTTAKMAAIRTATTFMVLTPKVNRRAGARTNPKISTRNQYP